MISTKLFSDQVVDKGIEFLTERPESGCYIYGLFVEGARWDSDTFELSESRPKELYTDMPVMWLIPTANRKQPETGIYLCPVYKTLTRAGEHSWSLLISTFRANCITIFAVSLCRHTVYNRTFHKLCCGS